MMNGSELLTYTLFLTSKVRLHCGLLMAALFREHYATFPDLKGQAPLRRHRRGGAGTTARSFPDLKGQAPLRRAG